MSETTTKEIAPVKAKVNQALVAVRGIVIKSKEDFEAGVELGNKIKMVSKAVTQRKEAITKPLNEALKSARDLFRPMENDLETAETELKKKMLDFKEEERKQIAETQAKAEARVEKGTMKEETAKRKVQEVKAEATEKTVKTETGAKATEKFVIEYVIVDEAQIPREFLVPDMAKIKLSFKEGKPVAGVEAQKKATMSF